MLISSAPLDHWTQACFPSFVTLVLFPCQTLSSLFLYDCKGSSATLNCQNLNGQIFTVVFSLTPNEDIRLEVCSQSGTYSRSVNAFARRSRVSIHFNGTAHNSFLDALKLNGRWTNAMILSPPDTQRLWG